MERPIVENKIAEVLKSHPKGSVLFVDDFLDYGNPESVKKALLRLKEKEILVRLAHGIYLYPKIDKELGVLFPSTEDIAKAIARRDKARIVPTGVQALNKLGIIIKQKMKRWVNYGNAITTNTLFVTNNPINEFQNTLSIIPQNGRKINFIRNEK